MTETALNGMKEISGFVGYSPSTILVWIRDCYFPARKLAGIWISDREEIAEWRRAYIRGELDEYNLRRSSGKKKPRKA